MNDVMDPSELSSDDDTVLEQSLEFINQRLTREQDRGDKAESRATTTLAATGVLAGFIVHLGDALNTAGEADKLILYGLFVGAILFLVKAGWYGIYSVRTLQGNELNLDLISDIQKLGPQRALKEEIRWKIWEHNQLQKVHIRRLFWLGRAQRNLAMAILTFMLLGALLISYNVLTFDISLVIEIGIVGLVALALLSIDSLVEKYGFWYWEEDNT